MSRKNVYTYIYIPANGARIPHGYRGIDENQRCDGTYLGEIRVI